MTEEYTSKTISVNARFVLLVAWMNEPLLNRAVTRTILAQSFQVQFFSSQTRVPRAQRIFQKLKRQGVFPN
jgi:hypothetical protein